jgi:hypothetical protein
VIRNGIAAKVFCCGTTKLEANLCPSKPILYQQVSWPFLVAREGIGFER